MRSFSSSLWWRRRCRRNVCAGHLRRFQADVSCHARYLYAGLRVADWVAATDKRTWDRPLCTCIKGLWLSGEVKLLVGDIFFAVQLFIHGVASSHGAWGRHQAPRRAALLPVKVQLAFTNVEVSWSDVRSAALVLLTVQ